MSEVQTKPVPSQSGSSENKTRNLLIFGTVGVFAAIVFGVLYLFVIAPAVPNGSLGWFLFSFATGLTMIVMPCTLPLAFVIVPLSMGKGMLRGLGMALAFGIGVATMLSTYGIIAALLGGFALDFLGNDIEPIKNWVYFIAGTFALLFALSEIGLLNIHMPSYSGAAPAFIQKRGELIKAFLLGLFLGNVGVGCPHPATPLILIEIASSGDILYGWLMFLVHAIGRVLPLLLLAFLAVLGVNGLNWLMARKATVERITGWGMVFVAGFILTLGLFTHDWWVNSGIHSALESVTQESFFNSWFNEALNQQVAHVHGLEDGVGLFGLPLWLGHWFLVLVWLIPIWWWYMRKRGKMMRSPAFKLKTLEAEIDRLEKDRRQIESMVSMEELDQAFQLGATETQLDELEKARRAAEEKVQYGEKGVYKDPAARTYEVKILGLHRNYLIVISIFLALVFIHFLPQNFYFKSLSGIGHDDGHDHGATQSLDGIHVMNGMVMNNAGEMIDGAHVMPDGAIMLADGTTVGTNGERVPLAGGTIFTKSIAGLPEAVSPPLVELQDGDTYDITASYVQKEIGNRTLRMLAYNKSVPGPFIKVDQGAEVTINFTNNTDVEQTIHSHGVRIDNNSDGVPGVTQDAVLPGGSHTYTIKFKDAGVYWYHPHTRDDYGQELGLYGNYLVDPASSNYWNPANREIPLVIDDILIENDQIVDFYREFTNFALLGRFGDTFLVNGEQDYTTTIEKGEVIRFMVTNVSNSRPYNFSIPGVEMKLVGADIGRYERETFVDNFVISPAERVVVEAYFDDTGTYKLTHTFNDTDHEIVRFLVEDTSYTPTSYADTFNALRQNQEVVDAFSTFRSYLDKEPDKRLLLTVDLSNAPVIDHSAHGHTHAAADATTVDHSQHAHMSGTGNRLDGIQWEDPGASDYTNTSDFVGWQLIDQETGKISMDIPVADWTFKDGSLVKVRLTNDATADHVMQHPIHFHGQRFVVLEENGVPNENMAWKDTVLVYPGEVVDILVDMDNLGEWMSHCHISEHLHAGMMLQFRVENQDGYATGDEYRATATGSHSMQQDSTNAAATKSSSDTSVNTLTGTAYAYDATVADADYFVQSANTNFKAGIRDSLAISFIDRNGNEAALEDTLDQVLSIYFVKSDGTMGFETFPGNNNFPQMRMMDDNVPGTPGFDESMPHTHSYLGIPYAFADAGHAPGEPHGTVNQGLRTYTVPVQFPDVGQYRGFVEFIVRGETEPRVAIIDVIVNDASFSIDNFGWSNTAQWWILLIASILLMFPLVWFVRRYLHNIAI